MYSNCYIDIHECLRVYHDLAKDTGLMNIRVNQFIYYFYLIIYQNKCVQKSN